MIWIGTMALTACMFVSPDRGSVGLPEKDPHEFFNSTENCTCCHEAEDEAPVNPRDLSVDVIETCTRCHPARQIGSSHPVGVRADERFPEMEIPAELPVDAEGRITCTTCHNPHLEGYSKERFSGIQAPAGVRVEDGLEVAYYKSYYLRIHAPEQGNDPTCAACHVGYL